MKKMVSIIAVMICSAFLQNSAFAQQTPISPEKLVIKEDKVLPNKDIKRVCKPEIKMPYQARRAFEFFKYADDLNLTDEQLIQLRGFYKKHYSKKAEKKEFPNIPSTFELYKMSDDELVKYADNEAIKIKERIMSRLQKIIDIRKILTDEQLKKLQEEGIKEAEKGRKEITDKNGKKPLPPNKMSKPGKPSHRPNHNKYQPNMNGCFMNPMWNYMPNMMVPNYPPMFHQPGMMFPPFCPMFHQPNMMAPKGMPAPRRHDVKEPHMSPMFKQQNMMNPYMGSMFMPRHMMNPCMKSMPMSNPMMNPYMGSMFMPNPMINSYMNPMCMKAHNPKCEFCHNNKHHMRPMNKKDNNHSKAFAQEPPKHFPLARLLMKFLSCQKDCNSDIINK